MHGNRTRIARSFSPVVLSEDPVEALFVSTIFLFLITGKPGKAFQSTAMS